MRSSIRIYCLATSAIAWGGFAIAAPAHAQASPVAAQAADTPATDTAGTDIVVTAERRTQSLQKAPLAISVRDGDLLRAEGRTTIEQILQDVPSVDFKENTGTAARNDTSATSIVIRGIGSNGAANGAVVSLVPAVAVYVDDVLGGIGESYDIERVEVLRGPQGTLYGRSATSGVVDIQTKQPKLSQFDASLSGELGNYDRTRLSGGVSVPIGDKLAVRVSGQHLKQDGYYSEEGGRIEVNDARIKALLVPVDGFSIEAGVAYEKRNFHSGGPTPQVSPAGIDTTFVAPIGDGNDRQVQVWAKIDLDLGGVTLTYIPAFRSYKKSEVQFGYFGTSLVNGVNAIGKDHFLTQELRLSSNGESRLKWQVGLFHYDNDIAATFDQTLNGTVKLHIGNINKETLNLGAFAEGTYAIADTTRVTGGIRYDYTRLNVDQLDCNSLGHPLTCATLSGAAGQRKWRNVTYKARVEQDLSPTSLVYASVSSAFLPGDIAIVTGAGGTLAASPYEAQKLTAYELGLKGRLFGNRLSLSAGVYFYDYGGYQQQIEIGSVGPVSLTAIGNSKARVKGAELEALFRPTPADTFQLNASYNDARFVDKSALFAKSVSQNKIPVITPFEATLSYSHMFDLGAAGQFRVKGEAGYYAAHDVGVLTAAQALSATISPLVRQGAVVLGNAFVTWEPSDWLTLSGYVRNIGDKRYKKRVDTAGTATRLNTELGAPRTIGVMANVQF